MGDLANGVSPIGSPGQGNGKTLNPAAVEMLEIAGVEGYSSAFSRSDSMKPCPIGAEGACCRSCYMGPCRLVGKNVETITGICGATLPTVVARNLARAVAGGTSAHSDHARDLAMTLLAVAKGEAQGYEIKDVHKLVLVAGMMGIKVDGRSKEEIALDVANKALSNFGQQVGEITYATRAPKKRQEIWRKLGVVPRGIDREVVWSMNATTMGVDQDAEHILDTAVRTALGDGWGGSMLGTDISDILFGTPKPLLSQVSLGVLAEDQVNVVVHGHEPTLSEMIVVASMDPELIAYAKSKGAKGINLAGICCTSNEILMRHGIPPAGNFLDQELAVMTGVVDAMVVDVQCIMEALVPLAQKFHTKVVTTSPKAKIHGATHIQFDEHHALDTAKAIVRAAIDNFPNRKTGGHIPNHRSDLVAGFSHEYIEYMLGGRYRGSFRPLNDAIIDGRIQGAVAIVGCNNPRVKHDEAHFDLVKEFIANDYLVVQTGCGAIASAKYGLLLGEAMEMAGPGLRSICEATGMPPVLHLGSCVDNSRILTILTAVVEEGGLGDDISDLPAVGIAPEWMSEKAIAIGTYCAASGAYVLFGVTSPTKASPVVVDLMSHGWEEKYGGKMEFEPDIKKIYEKSVEHIQKKRKALGIDTKKERVLFDMEARRELSV
ncbi:MAG TPA: anaerobic carbon-monoxide dehydrogenase catalytic subunit [Chloroflexota bacterium]